MNGTASVFQPSSRRVYGGLIYLGTPGCNIFQKYDVAAGTWTALTANPTAVASGTGIVADHGTELVMVHVADTGSSMTRPYNIAGNSWGSTRTAFPGANTYAPAICQDNTYVYVISGEGGDNLDGGGDSLNAWKYALATDTWTQIHDLDVGFWGAGSDVGLDGKVYVMGGTRDSSGSGTGVVRVYNPSGNTWATKANPPVHSGDAYAILPVCAQLADGDLLYGGGQPNVSVDGFDFWTYATGSDTFTATTASNAHSSTLLSLGDMQAAIYGTSIYCGSSAWSKTAEFIHGV